MGTAMRTMAFQIPQDLFNQIKDYLDRHQMTQKQFVIGLIQDELDRDYEERQAMSEGQEQLDDEPDEDEGEELDQDEDEDETEGKGKDEDLDESEDMDDSEDMSMGM